MVVIHSKEILYIKKLIKKPSSNDTKGLVILTLKKLLVLHLGLIYAAKTTSPHSEVDS